VQSELEQDDKRKALGRVEDLPIQRNYELSKDGRDYGERQASNQALAQKRAPRKEQSVVPEPEAMADLEDAVASNRVRIFESEVDPFEFAMLGREHGVLYRKVWRDGRRTIQGAVLAQTPFLQQAIAVPFRNTALAQMSDLVIAWDGDVLQSVPGDAARGSYDATQLSGELLHQTRLSAPLGKLQLLWTINRLPAGAGAGIVGWSSLVLFAVLTLGFLALYRLGLRQIRLAHQQRNFVSAVSHELKTPLTSIRMYAEMLREGWVDEEKRRGYYAFIHDESERLSRLIANVLQLARMERDELRLECKPITVAALVDVLRSRLSSQVERAGFVAIYAVEATCAERELEVDQDAFVQIFINLVDNALKFAATAGRREIEIAVRAQGEQAVRWSVRDYGPGVPKSQLRKIFELFYRAGAELTRETAGTGIGLALVRQLARAMRGEVDVVNREPGAEFQVTLPAHPSSHRVAGPHQV
jgi:signal transduction histidine kinase